LLHQSAKVIKDRLLGLQNAHHALETVPWCRRQALDLNDQTLLRGHDLRDRRSDPVTLIGWRRREVLLEGDDPCCDRAGTPQEARAHGRQRAIKLILNGHRSAHLVPCWSTIRA